MAQLKIDTGIVEYDLNDAVTVRFNPTDADFIERLYNTFSGLDKKQEEINASMNKVKTNAEVFDLARKYDAEMRDMINGLFESDICTPLFGKTNVYALASGCPLWFNLLMVIMDEIDTSVTAQHKAKNPRIEKYIKKYHK